MMMAHEAGARSRAAIIAAHPDLRERELVKLAVVAAEVAEALRRRGVTEPAATLAAEAGLAVFRTAFGRWIAAPGGPDLARLIAEALGELKAVAAGASSAPAPAASRG
jgi:hypothetical protein